MPSKSLALRFKKLETTSNNFPTNAGNSGKNESCPQFLTKRIKVFKILILPPNNPRWGKFQPKI